MCRERQKCIETLTNSNVQASSGCRMDVDRSTSSVNVVGPRGAVAKASAMLQYTIGENKRAQSQNDVDALCLRT